MPPRVRSVNVGASAPNGPKGVRSGIGKQPSDAIEVRAPGPKAGGLGSGVVGDFVGDRRHHGGDNQAVYAVARAEIDWWETHLGRSLPDGRFGENLTIAGYDVDGALLGERWRVGSALLEVTGPRVPCQTFAWAMGEPRWVKRFAERGRIDVVPDHGITVPMSFRAYLGDRELARRIVELGAANPDLAAKLLG
jgi:MOSC domain-containing protein YiiM